MGAQAPIERWPIWHGVKGQCWWNQSSTRAKYKPCTLPLPNPDALEGQSAIADYDPTQ
jgi:hypothetical protein